MDYTLRVQIRPEAIDALRELDYDQLVDHLAKLGPVETIDHDVLYAADLDAQHIYFVRDDDQLCGICIANYPFDGFALKFPYVISIEPMAQAKWQATDLSEYATFADGEYGISAIQWQHGVLSEYNQMFWRYGGGLRVGEPQFGFQQGFGLAYVCEDFQLAISSDEAIDAIGGLYEVIDALTAQGLKERRDFNVFA